MNYWLRSRLATQAVTACRDTVRAIAGPICQERGNLGPSKTDGCESALYFASSSLPLLKRTWNRDVE